MSEVIGSLIKVLLVLVGLGAVVALGPQIIGKDKIGSHIANLSQTSLEIQSLYASQGTFTTLTNAVVLSGGLAPDAMSATGTLRNPWGGAMTFAVNGTNSARFNITDTGVPQEACGKIASAVPNLVGLTINGTAQTLPADAGALVTACSGATNTLIYTFSR